MATARWRPDPEFLVIGAKRGGSTAFYYDLLQHPQIAPLFPRPDHLPKQRETKGIHYFDQHYWRGERWYRSYLPSNLARHSQQRRAGATVITGEASPYYLYHPAAAERASRLLPDVKLIAVLRDPVLRTFSHWKERRRSGLEDLDFAAALAAEDARIGADAERLRTDPTFSSYAHEQQSYVHQSEYDTALEEWLRFYPRERLLVIPSESYYRDPAACVNEAAKFLGLAPFSGASRDIRNAAPGHELDDDIAAELAHHFRPHNDRLADLLGMKFDWR